MYSRVSLNKLQLNITSPEGNELKLSQGEILKGQVKDVKDNGLVLIYLKGRLIEALSEVMVKPGDTLYLMVEDFKDKKAYLKVLTPESLSRLENDALAFRLRELGISPQEQEVLIAKKLIQHHLPLTQENVRKLLSGVKMLGEFNARNLEIAAFALAKGIPLNKETLSLITYHLDKNTGLAELIDDVLKLSSQYAEEPGLLDANQPEETGKGRYIDAAGFKGTAKPEVSGEQGLNQGLSGNKADYKLSEAKIESSLRMENISGLKTDMPEGVNLSKQAIFDYFRISDRFRPLMIFLGKVFEEIRINPALLRENNLLAARLKEVLAAEKDLIQVLDRFLEAAAGEKGVEKSHPAAQFLRALESIEKEISGNRLFNFISRQGADNSFNYYYFAWPVKLNDSTYLLEMRVNREKRYKSLKDADSLTIAVALDTPRMGKVLFHVSWIKNYKLELRGVVETVPVKEYIEKNISELVDVLSGLGYRVDYLGTRVAESREEMVINRIRLMETEEKVKPFGIDVIV